MRGRGETVRPDPCATRRQSTTTDIDREGVARPSRLTSLETSPGTVTVTVTVTVAMNQAEEGRVRDFCLGLR